MFAFFSMVISGLVGALLSPYVNYFFNIKITNRIAKLEYLQEAYELTKKYQAYINQSPLAMTFIIASLKNQIQKDSIPKLIESPVDRLLTLLDYYLCAPKDLINRIEIQQNEIVMSHEPIPKTDLPRLQ